MSFKGRQNRVAILDLLLISHEIWGKIFNFFETKFVICKMGMIISVKNEIQGGMLSV